TVTMRPVASVLQLAGHMMQPLLELLASGSLEEAVDGGRQFRQIPPVAARLAARIEEVAA
ncbi:MAG TPA: hypothetical protein VGJ70_17250, partial [Solirubrobacteraceae bacterium]